MVRRTPKCVVTQGLCMGEDGRGHHHSERSPTDTPRHAASGGHQVNSLPGGLSIAADGYRLVPQQLHFERGVEQPLSFEIRDSDGRVVTEFEETHGKLSHLIVVRRDLTHFQHLHPELRQDGTWTQDISFASAGVYRAFIDVRIDGSPTTLGTDLFVPGEFEIWSRPSSTRVAEEAGYEVTLTTETIPSGEEAILEFIVKDATGERATLQEHLEAMGHLVALREGDLGYLHVHPEETAPDSGVIRFRGVFPTAGRYRLFLQAKPDGNLITTTFDLQLRD